MKKNILITGSYGYLGSYLKSFFLKKNFNVISVGRKNKKIVNNKNNYFCDLSNETEVASVFNSLKKKYPKIFCIISCAGNSKKIYKKYETKKDWENSFNDNFYSFVNVLQFYLKYYKSSPTNIISISSIVDKTIINAPIAYSISKNALTNFCKIKSDELAKKKIKINVISPGNILIKNNNWYKKIKLNKASILKYIKKNVPMNAFSKKEDIADMCLYIIEKNRNITGSRFVIDSGQSRNI